LNGSSTPMLVAAGAAARRTGRRRRQQRCDVLYSTGGPVIKITECYSTVHRELECKCPVVRTACCMVVPVALLLPYPVPVQ
jgi:hypothetical protein